MNVLTTETRAAIVRALVEGNSVRATARLTGTAKATVLKLLVELGEFCSIYQDHTLRDLPCRRVEADEIWAFCGAKQKNATKEGQGDIWTFTAIDADSKLMVSWLVGQRTGDNAHRFMADVAFGWNGTDYAQIIKTYGTPLDETERQRRYSPAVCTGAIMTPIMGKPDMGNVSTSFVERSNLSIRMGMRRFTRLTNGFSKKAENHAYAVSLYFMHYNYCRPHMTLTKENGGIKTAPAMAAGIADHMWTVEEILDKMRPDYLLHSN